jgi:hypothetical protein
MDRLCRFMHVGKGRRNPLHVDCIFLGATLGYIQDSITEAILAHPKLDIKRKVAIVKAIGKVIWIQNDLLARWHISDGEEYKDSPSDVGSLAENYLPSDKVPSLATDVASSDDERFIRSSGSGKTSLGRNIEEVEQAAASREHLVCPFSGAILEDQRAELTRAPRKDLVNDPLRQHPPGSGIPRLHVVDGKTVCKDKLERNPLNFEIGRAE